jgi:hypothetical protein
MKKLPAILLSVCFLSLSTLNVVYAQDNALEKAENAIQAYFNAILTDESTLGPNMAMDEAAKEVPDKDQSALQDYYDRASLSAARQAVDAYAKKVTAGQDASNDEDKMHEIEDALSPDSLQKIKLYYDQIKKTNPKMS